MFSTTSNYIVYFIVHYELIQRLMQSTLLYIFKNIFNSINTQTKKNWYKTMICASNIWWYYEKYREFDRTKISPFISFWISIVKYQWSTVVKVFSLMRQFFSFSILHSRNIIGGIRVLPVYIVLISFLSNDRLTNGLKIIRSRRTD